MIRFARYCLFIAFSALVGAVPAFAQTICTATVLHDVRAQQDGNLILRAGQKFDAVTQFWKNSDGRTYFCQKGGYCYEGDAIENGKIVPSMKLDNCAVDLANPDRDEDGNTLYYVNVQRSAVDSVRLRKYDVESRLIELGLCSSCADNAATVYLEEPNSECATATRSALEGNTEALRLLINKIEICSVPAGKIYDARQSGSDQ